MFSAHFFFESEASFRNFIANASSALEDSGLFYGTLASGMVDVVAMAHTSVCGRY
jgi:hypothetical protein